MKGTNHFQLFDVHFRDGVGSLSLIIIHRRETHTMIMYSDNQIMFELPDL
jgi:hypothetical protein